LLALPTEGYLGLIVLFATSILRWTLCQSYAGLNSDVRVFALPFIRICRNQPSETFLIVSCASKLLLAQRSFWLMRAVLVLYLVPPWGVPGSRVGLLIVHGRLLVLLLIAERLASARRTCEAATAKLD
jgi:hypothetical protein